MEVVLVLELVLLARQEVMLLLLLLDLLLGRRIGRPDSGRRRVPQAVERLRGGIQARGAEVGPLERRQRRADLARARERLVLGLPLRADLARRVKSLTLDFSAFFSGIGGGRRRRRRRRHLRGERGR